MAGAHAGTDRARFNAREARMGSRMNEAKKDMRRLSRDLENKTSSRQ
ncbi:hypothetical protein NKS27_24420 [Peribacillus frigoritolerans]|nr:hypothetical protein [Peribacillus frigoritolerans]MCP1155513.1 hypothetical protein [Peribacillus frigoritolerans]